MKKGSACAIIIIIIICTMPFVFAGCGGDAQKTTQLTLPASVIENSQMRPGSDLSSFTDENGFESAEWNEDGSLTITLTNARKAEVAKKMEEGLLASFDAIVNDPNTDYIKSIEPSSGYRVVTITAEREAYESSFELTVFVVGLSTAVYQAYAGEEPGVDVVVVDAATGEQIESGHYPEQGGG